MRVFSSHMLVLSAAGVLLSVNVAIALTPEAQRIVNEVEKKSEYSEVCSQRKKSVVSAVKSSVDRIKANNQTYFKGSPKSHVQESIKYIMKNKC